jgi:hypothetical protein
MSVSTETIEDYDTMVDSSRTGDPNVVDVGKLPPTGKKGSRVRYRG